MAPVAKLPADVATGVNINNPKLPPVTLPTLTPEKKIKQELLKIDAEHNLGNIENGTVRFWYEDLWISGLYPQEFYRYQKEIITIIEKNTGKKVSGFYINYANSKFTLGVNQNE
ncbi:hypothetical protein [Bacillus sp. AFS031507]|uniref:hypothetical protein n=1 Tax=Bacillus sp. AFS031507 TaxID=2033496 RepID=UPI000BFD4226|nr:hypothetical protein [Bacillus sp. AFS031507]PGY06324.1 hypothetical protein COE25_28005 [Bacillus sp. AFS031507]